MALKIGDRVVDPYSFDGPGTVVGQRHTDSHIASGKMIRRGSQYVLVKFDNSRSPNRWIAADQLETVS